MSSIIYSAETEQAVLGCILSDNNYSMPRCIAAICPDDFYDNNNKSIYETALDLYKKGIVIDAVLLIQANASIPASYIAALADGVATARVIGDYLKTLKEISERRQVTRRIGALKQALNDGKDADAEIDGFITDIGNIKKNTGRETIQVKNLVTAVYEKINNGRASGVLSGFDEIDKKTRGFNKQNLIIIATGTGKGKTAFSLNIAAHAASAGKNVLIFSLEMSSEEIVERLIAIVSGVSTRMTRAEIEDACWTIEERADKLAARRIGTGRLSDMSIYIDDRPNDALGITAVARNIKFELERKEKTLDLIIVDYLQLVKSSEKTNNREQQVGSIADELKFLAKRLNVPVIALAQTNRLADGEKRHYAIGDLRESSRIEQNADMILFLNRDSVDNSQYVLECGKYRHGSVFKQDLIFTSETLTFKEKLWEGEK